MREITIFLTFLIILGGCAGMKTKIYDQSGIKDITQWHIGFKYETSELKQKVTHEGTSESTITKKGELASDLQFRDDLFFLLKDDHNINLVKNKDSASGFIKISLVHFGRSSDYFRSVDVTFYNREDVLLARIRVRNGDRVATAKDPEEFAEYAAKAMANILK